jgi:glycosyltransferase involved in cell wall biosynthesis
MITWLATYPRSGNALLRAILHQTMGLEAYANPEYLMAGAQLAASVRLYNEAGSKPIQEPWKEFYLRHRESRDCILVKTHERREDSMPAIYVVRDGRKALYSYYNYYRTLPCPEKLPGLLELVLGGDWFGSWSAHYAAWHSASHPRLLTVRFEELADADDAVLRRLADFLGYEGEIRPWRNPLGKAGEHRNVSGDWVRPPEWNERVDRAFWAVQGELMEALGYGRPGEIPRQSVEEKSEWLNLARMAQEHAVYHRENGRLQSQVGEVQRNLGSLRWARAHVRNLRRARPSLWKAPDDWFWYRLMESNRCQPGYLWQYKPRKYGAFFRPKQMLRNASPLPSIAMAVPSFNQAAYIKTTLDSILDQQYPRLELAVMDAGSRDGTVEVLKPMLPRFAAYRSHKDSGQAAAVNEGLARVRGEICAWLNSDDLLLPGSLRLIGRYFADHPEVDAVYGYRLVVNDEGLEVGRWFMPCHDDEDLRWFDYVPQETLFFRRELWDRVGGVTDSFQFALDWDLLVRFIGAKARIVRLPYFLGAFRAHEEQKTRTLISTTGQWEMAAIRQRTLGRIPESEEIKKRQLAFRGRASIWAHLYKHKIRF